LKLDRISARPLSGARARPASPSDVPTAMAITGLLLMPPAFLPHMLSHSSYLFGMAAVLISATRAGAAGALTSGAMVIIAALFIDRRAGIGEAESLIRAVIFLFVAISVAYGARALAIVQASSSKAIGELAQKEAVLRSIFDTGPDAMLVIDSRGIVLNFSLAAERLFGWSPAEVIGHNVSMLMPSPYQREHDGYIGRYLGTGERRIIGKSREVRGLRKDGSHFPMVLHVGEVQLGAERRFTGIVHDLTALNEAHDRTQQLRNQLTHVWRMNSLGEMAAMLAHELNQPLTAISNYVRGARSLVYRMELEDEELLDALEKAGAQAIRAGEIIRRTRAMVAREAGEPQESSLGELISEIELMMGLIARESDVPVRYRLEPGPDVVWVDRIQIQQVVGNLVRNAVEALRGHPERVLQISSEKSSNGWIVRVEDSGPGIPTEIANQLFEPLTSTKHRGMGLGLSICRTIIEHHQGAIWVEKSRLGGAAFCFSLLSGKPGIAGAVGAASFGTDSLRH
jgi:two-component system sensor kinase FixL